MSLYTTPLAAYTSQHIRGATSLPTDLTSSTRRQIPLPPVVVIRVLGMVGSQKLSQPTPTKPTPALVHSHNRAVHPGDTDDSRCRRRAHSRGERAAHTLHSGTQVPPGSCGRPHRTCACRDQGNQSSGLQGPGRGLAQCLCTGSSPALGTSHGT